MLELKNINFSYGNHHVLKDVDLNLENGVTALLGPNGAGKTTMINVIVGLLQPDSGEVWLDGTEIKTLKTDITIPLDICHRCQDFIPIIGLMIS